MDIRRRDGGRSHGADQDWYTLPWRRRAGCGPTAASVQMAYLAAQRPSMAALCPLEGREQGTFAAYMDQVWDYVTPGEHGLNRVEMYTGGVARFCRDRGVRLALRALEVPAGGDRPGFDLCTDFIRAGLASDCPVAFLNFSHGALKNLDSWHWVPLTAMTEGESVLLCTILDEGEARVIDLALWWETSSLGGALVGLFPDMESDQTDG